MSVPGVLGVDAEGGWVVLEYVGGRTVRGVLDEWAHAQDERGKEDSDEGSVGGGEGRGNEGEREEGMKDLMKRVGREVGKLHGIGVCHGDLTTSNLLLRSPPASQPTASTAPELDLQGDVVLIDFGLTTASIQDEDKAVDLYVLERAFAATHPAAEPLFQEVLRAYGESYQGAKAVLRRLEGVRGRGRKRSMLG